MSLTVVLFDCESEQVERVDLNAKLHSQCDFADGCLSSWGLQSLLPSEDRRTT